MKRLLFLSLLLSISAWGMNKEKNVEICVEPGPLYIGKGFARQEIETAYGKPFDLNTIFFKVAFHNYKNVRNYGNDIESTKKLRAPEYVSYEYIRNCKEGHSLTLPMYGKQFIVFCRQKRNKNSCSDKPFEKIVRLGIEEFKKRPVWLCDGSETLIQAGVIERVEDEFFGEHGPNGYPFDEE